MGYVKKEVHNVSSGAKNTIQDVGGSVKGFINNPLQSVEKGIGQTVNTANLGLLGKAGIKDTTIGGAVLLAAGATGAYALMNPATGQVGYTTAAPIVGPGGTVTTAAPVVDASGNVLAAAGQPFSTATLTSAAGSAAAKAAIANGTISSFISNNAGSLIGAGIMAGAGIYSSNKQADLAGQAQADQTAIMNRSLDLEAQQLADAKNLGQQQIDLSKQQYQRNVDIGNKIEANATLSPDYIDSTVAGAGLTASKSYQNQIDAQKRGLMRMGVDPSSGAFVGADREARLAAAGGTSDAMNTTRLGLTNYAKSLKAQALSAELGISNPTIGATGQQSSQAVQTAGLEANTGATYGGIYGNQAAQYQTNAANEFNSGLNAAGTILGYGLTKRVA